MYKYYSTQRPIDPGTFPQPEGNPPLEVINYDERLPVSGEVFGHGASLPTKSRCPRQTRMPMNCGHPVTTGMCGRM